MRSKAKPAINNNSTTTIDVKQRFYLIQVSLADTATSPPHFSLNFTPIFGVLRTNCFLMHGQWEERLWVREEEERLMKQIKCPQQQCKTRQGARGNWTECGLLFLSLSFFLSPLLFKHVFLCRRGEVNPKLPHAKVTNNKNSSSKKDQKEEQVK